MYFELSALPSYFKLHWTLKYQAYSIRLNHGGITIISGVEEMPLPNSRRMLATKSEMEQIILIQGL
jgi:hypothetical protein